MSEQPNPRPQLILPPPIVAERQPIRNMGIRGQIQVDETGQLFGETLRYQGLVRDVIESYNNVITYEIPQILKQYHIELSEGRKIRFTNFRAYPPVDNAGNPLSPFWAHETGHDFVARTTAILEEYDANDVLMGRTKDEILIGSIPVMTGSILDKATYQKSDAEKLAIGECPSDPFGYFYIKGSPKFIVINSELRHNVFLIYRDKGKDRFKGIITSRTFRGTTQVILLTDPARRDIRLSVTGFKQDEYINVFQAFRLLGLKEPDAIIKFIEVFTRPEWRGRIHSVLQSNKVSLFLAEDDIISVGQAKGDKQPEQLNPVRDLVLRDFQNQLFSHVDDLNGKLRLLGLITARYAEFMAGLRPPDDRNSVGNMSMRVAGLPFSRLYNDLFYRIFIDPANGIMKSGELEQSLEGIAAKVRAQHTTFGNFFLNAFGPKKWGIKGSYSKENITDMLKRESIPVIYAQMARINTPTNRKGKQFEVRAISATQPGYIDLTDSPEGSASGLVKNKAVTAFVSLNRSEEKLLSFLGKTFSDTPLQGVETLLILNGRPLGWTRGAELAQALLEAKRQGDLAEYWDLLVLHREDDRELLVYCDAGRLVRPLLIVNQQTSRLRIDELDLWGRPFEQLLKAGVIEYVDVLWQEKLYISQTVDNIRTQAQDIQSIHDSITNLESLAGKDSANADTYQRQINDLQLSLESMKEKAAYTHCEIHPRALLGVAASLIPLPEHNSGTKNVFQCSMTKQALGIFHSNHNLRFESGIKTLAHPGPPIFDTYMTKILKMDQLPAGNEVVVAIASHTGYNQEDAIIFNKAALDRGLFTYIAWKSYKTSIKSVGKVSLIIQRPRPEYLGNDPKRLARYANIDSDGIVKIGTPVNQGDVLVSVVRMEMKDNTPVFSKMEDLVVGHGESGVVDRIYVERDVSGARIRVKVKTRDVRVPEVGDKFSSRYAQKGVIGIVLGEEDMPYTDDGIIPSIIINPYGIFSRMTMGKLIEMLTSKVAAIRGEAVDASAFNNFKTEEFMTALRNHGYNLHGHETMYNPHTGLPYQCDIMVGPCYYQALRHHPKDKIYFRNTGAKRITTNQPVKGRKKGGALRFGEMERDTIISHGAVFTLRETLHEASDLFKAIFCDECGTLAIAKPSMGAKRIPPVCPRDVTHKMFSKCTFSGPLLYMSHLLFGMGISIRTPTTRTPTSGIRQLQGI